ncbi:hypothetical protein BDN72DRAFT_769601 [Pluteus cervinus]|uniref:Uncharacterized protein n=1 Tax=Pluteus cervinus TaxID=181527 RepID=A0ACD3AR90_9AGAR|nr:hypothetical protein BDN72DRAFT_769601 [Pluteus cervinus]
MKVFATDHQLKSVTVFKSDTAEIVRNFRLDLQPTQNKIEIVGLSSAIDTRSVRVSGLGEARLFDVVCTVEDTKAHDPDALTEEIRKLTVKKASLEGEKEVRASEANFLVSYAKTLNGEHVKPSEMASFLSEFVEQGRKNVVAVAEIDEKILAVEREISTLKEELSLIKGSTRGQVKLVIVADEEITIDLKLTYIVAHASWHPTYELHATTTSDGRPSPTVSLHYRARVTQSTGEDWTDTSLTLSTVASDVVAQSLPQPIPFKIRPRNGFFQKPLFPTNNFNNPQKFALATQSQTLLSFGQQAQQQQQPQQSIFGNPQPQSYSAFGQPATGGGLFGAAPATTGGGIFGSAPTTTGGAFGSSTGTGLFGSTAPAPASTGLFGSAPSAPAASPFTGFGSAAPAAPTGFGGGLFGSAAASSGPAPAFGASAANPGGPTEPDAPAADAAEESFEELALHGTLDEPKTTVTETPVAVSFSVKGQTTIPSDGIDHRVSVAILPFEANISHITVPSTEPRVYLQCEVKNTSEYRLLPGPCSVILDDSYVSKTSIKDVNLGDTFDCTLGHDASTTVLVARKRHTTRPETSTFVEAINITTYTTTITVHNKHAFTINNLIIRDVIPTSEDARAKVILRKPKGLAEAKDGVTISVKDDLTVAWEKVVDGKGGQKEGKFEWKGKLDSGEKANYISQWEVKAPSDFSWFDPFTPVFGQPR